MSLTTTNLTYDEEKETEEFELVTTSTKTLSGSSVPVRVGINESVDGEWDELEGEDGEEGVQEDSLEHKPMELPAGDANGTTLARPAGTADRKTDGAASLTTELNASSAQDQPTEASVSSLLGGRLESFATVVGAQFVPIRPWPVSVSSDVSKRKTEHQFQSNAMGDHPRPYYQMKLERIKRKEKFDAFDEDEEPVLRTEFQPYTQVHKCSKLEIREEKITTFDVRVGLPNRKDQRKEGTAKTLRRISRRSTKSSRYTTSSNAPRLNENSSYVSPHQRDLMYVSYEELAPEEVAILKGLWKCITYDLWTFGALTTINIFRIRGHIADNDQKASPEVMMQCRILWPHAKQAMLAIEKVVLNLDKPTISHQTVYDVGRKHGKLKVPLNYDQVMIIIEAFLYTFSQHVHPIPTMKEMNILRKFCNITMFLFMDASRWDSEPMIPQ